jgi:hypothetical protein
MGIDAQMFIKTRTDVTPERLKSWSYIFGSAFKYHLSIGYKDKIWHKPIEKIEVYEQDGDDIIPATNETFLRVYPSGRYYGIGYERGPIMTYIQMAEFLERLIPNCEVWYGGDSSGACAELFDKTKREKLINHFISANGHDSYNHYFDKDSNGPDCPVCEVKMVQNGWGPDYKAYGCLGCGWQRSERSGEVREGFDGLD